MKSWHETITLPTNWIAQYKLASHNNATIDDVEKKLVDFARSVAIAIRSSRMEKLLAKAASISAEEFPKLVTCNWPLATGQGNSV